MAIQLKGIGATEREKRYSLLQATRPNFNDRAYQYAEQIGASDNYLSMIDKLEGLAETPATDMLKTYNSGNQYYTAAVIDTMTDEELKDIVTDIDKDGLVPYQQIVKDSKGNPKQTYNADTDTYDYVYETVKLTPRERLQRQFELGLEQEKEDYNLVLRQIAKNSLSTGEKVFNDIIGAVGNLGIGTLKFADNLLAMVDWIRALTSSGSAEKILKGDFSLDVIQNSNLRLFSMLGIIDDEAWNNWLADYTDFKNVDGSSTGTASDIILATTDTIGRMVIPALLTFGLSSALSGAGYTAETISTITDVTSTAVFYSSYYAEGVKEMADLRDKYNLKISDAGILAKQTITTAVEIAIERGLDKLLGPTGLEKILFGRSSKFTNIQGSATKQWIAKWALDAFHEALEEGSQEFLDGIINETFNAINADYKATGTFSLESIGQSALVGLITSSLGSVVNLGLDNVRKFKTIYEVDAETGKKVYRNKEGKYVEYVRNEEGTLIEKVLENQNIKTKEVTEGVSLKEKRKYEYEQKNDGTRGRRIYRNAEGKILNKDGTVAEKQDIKTTLVERKPSAFETSIMWAQLSNFSEAIAQVQDETNNIRNVYKEFKGGAISAEDFKSYIETLKDTVRFATSAAYIVSDFYGKIGNEQAIELNNLYKAFEKVAAINSNTAWDKAKVARDAKGKFVSKGKIIDTFEGSLNEVINSMADLLPNNIDLAAARRIFQRITEAQLDGKTTKVNKKDAKDMLKVRPIVRGKAGDDFDTPVEEVLDIIDTTDIDNSRPVSMSINKDIPIGTRQKIKEVFDDKKLNLSDVIVCEDGNSPQFFNLDGKDVLVCTVENLNKLSTAELTQIKVQQMIVEDIVAGRILGLDIDAIVEYYKKYAPGYSANKDTEELATIAVTSLLFDPAMYKIVELSGSNDIAKLYVFLAKKLTEIDEKIETTFIKGILFNIEDTLIELWKNNPFILPDLSYIPQSKESGRKALETILSAHKNRYDVRVSDFTNNGKILALKDIYSFTLCAINDLASPVKDIFVKRANRIINCIGLGDDVKSKALVDTYALIKNEKRYEAMYKGKYRAEFTTQDIIFNQALRNGVLGITDIREIKDDKTFDDISNKLKVYTAGKYILTGNFEDFYIEDLKPSIFTIENTSADKRVVAVTKGPTRLPLDAMHRITKFIENRDYSVLTFHDIVSNPTLLKSDIYSNIYNKYGNLSPDAVVAYLSELLVKDGFAIVRSMSGEWLLANYFDYSEQYKQLYKSELIADKLQYIYEKLENASEYAFYGSNTAEFGFDFNIPIYFDKVKNSRDAGHWNGDHIVVHMSDFSNFTDADFTTYKYKAGMKVTDFHTNYNMYYVMSTIAHESTHAFQYYNLLFGGLNPTVVPDTLVKDFQYKQYMKNDNKRLFPLSPSDIRFYVYMSIFGEYSARGDVIGKFAPGMFYYYDGYIYTPWGKKYKTAYGNHVYSTDTIIYKQLKDLNVVNEKTHRLLPGSNITIQFNFASIRDKDGNITTISPKYVDFDNEMSIEAILQYCFNTYISGKTNGNLKFPVLAMQILDNNTGKVSPLKYVNNLSLYNTVNMSLLNKRALSYSIKPKSIEDKEGYTHKELEAETEEQAKKKKAIHELLRNKTKKRRESEISVAKKYITKINKLREKAKTATIEQKKAAVAKYKALVAAKEDIKNIQKLKSAIKTIENKIDELTKEVYTTNMSARTAKISNKKKIEAEAKVEALEELIAKEKEKLKKIKDKISELSNTTIYAGSRKLNGKIVKTHTKLSSFLNFPDPISAINYKLIENAIIFGKYDESQDKNLIRARELISKQKEAVELKDKWDFGFGKKTRITNSEAKGTNFEYYKQKGKDIEVSKNIQNFIVGVDLDKVDYRIANGIRSGTLRTLSQILDVIEDSVYEPINQYTFDALKGAIEQFRNPYISTIDDLVYLVKNIEKLWSLVQVYKGKEFINKITTIDDIKNKLDDIENEEHPLHEKYAKAFASFGHFVDEKGKKQDVSINEKDAIKRILRIYDGTLRSLHEIARSVISSSTKQEGLSLAGSDTRYIVRGEVKKSGSIDRNIFADEDDSGSVKDQIDDESSHNDFEAVEDEDDDISFDDKRRFLFEIEASAIHKNNDTLSSTAVANMVTKKLESLTPKQISDLYEYFTDLKLKGKLKDDMIISKDVLKVAREERTARNIVKNIKQKWERIRSGLALISKPALKAIIRENEDIFTVDGKLKDELWYVTEKVYGKGKKTYDKHVYTLTDEELKDIEQRLKKFDKELRDRLTKNLEDKKFSKEHKQELERITKELAKTKERLALTQEELKKEKARIKEKTVFVTETKTVKIANNGFTYDTIGNREVPEVLKTILMTDFGDEAITNVKGISDPGDTHQQANYKAFFDANSKTLGNLTQGDVDTLLDFYTNISAESFDSELAYNRYTWIKLVMFQYLAEQARRGIFTISEETLQTMKDMTSSIFTEAGQILALKSNKYVTFNFNPVVEITKQILKEEGFDVPEEYIIDLVDTTDELLSYSIALKKTPLNAENRTEIENKLLELTKKVQDKYDEIYKEMLDNGKLTNRNVFDKLIGIQRLCMLSSPGTMLRNITSNIALKYGNKVADKIGQIFARTKIGQKAITKTTELSKYQYSFVGEISAEANAIANSVFIEQLYTMISDGLLKQDTKKIEKNNSLKNLTTMMTDTIRTRIFQAKTYHNKFVSNWAKIIQQAMNDDKFIHAKFKEYLGLFLTQRWNSISENEQQTITSITDNVATAKNFKDISTTLESVIVDAYIQAANDYQHTPNFIQRMEDSIKKYGGNIAYFVYKQIMPFASASWNWFLEALKWTPLGLAKSIKDIVKIEDTIARMDMKATTYKAGIASGNFAVANTLRNIGKGFIGTALTAVGILLALAGVAELDKDDNDRVKLKIGDLYVDVSNITGTSGLLFGMALFSGKDGLTWNNVLSATRAMFDDMVLMQVESNLRGYKDGDWLYTMMNNEFRMFWPAIFRNVARVINPYTTAYSSAWYKIFEKWANNVPILANMLPKEIDPYTGEYKLTYSVPILMQIVNEFTPIKVATYIASNNQREVLAQGLRKSQIKIDGLNAVQQENLNSIYGTLNNTSLSELFNNKVKYDILDEDKNKYVSLYYSQMSKEQKKRVIERIMSNNASYAKVSYLTKNGYKYYTSQEELKKLRKLGISKNVYLKTSKLQGYVKS